MIHSQASGQSDQVNLLSFRVHLFIRKTQIHLGRHCARGWGQRCRHLLLALKILAACCFTSGCLRSLHPSRTAALPVPRTGRKTLSAIAKGDTSSEGALRSMGFYPRLSWFPVYSSSTVLGSKVQYFLIEREHMSQRTRNIRGGQATLGTASGPRKSMWKFPAQCWAWGLSGETLMELLPHDRATPTVRSYSHRMELLPCEVPHSPEPLLLPNKSLQN